jgi:pectate lyase
MHRWTHSFIILAVIAWCALAGVVVADFNWNAESGNWADGANWDKGYKPDGTENVNLRKSSTSVCTLNTDEGLFSNRLMIQNGQTWNIEDGGRVGFAWSRIGYGGPAKVTMTGNSTFVLNNDDLYIGEINGNAIWTMYDTSSIVLADPSRNDDNLYIGKDGNGTLRIVGSKVTIRPSRIDFGWIRTAGCTPVSTLEYVMDEGGASTIVVQRINKIGDPDSTNHLVLSATAPLPQRDIVLIEATTGYGIGGKGKFDTLNGGPADEGTQIVLGGNVYALTYAYEANDDGIANDVALVYEPDPYTTYKAHSPHPYDGATVLVSPTTLRWVNPEPPDGHGEPTCTVYLGTTPDREAMDQVTLEPGVCSVPIDTAAFATFGAQPLTDETTYYWIVDCAYANAALPSEAGQGEAWTFHTSLSLPQVDGFGGWATGGAGGATVTVSDFNAFKYYATSVKPYTIRVSGTIDFGQGGKVQPTSNKTIEGVDHNATIIGNIDLSGSQNCDNIIIRNLTVTNPYPEVDGITVWGATNVLITHCTVYDCGDGLIDITRTSDNVTVSWCKFYYTDPSAPHRFTMISGNDPAAHPHITLHHNWWAQNCDQRMPSGSWSTVHMYNNYFTCTGNYYCSNVRDGGEMLSESNYYLNVNNPVSVSLPPAEGQPAGRIKTVANAYVSCTGTIYPGQDTVFSPPYAYSVDAAGDVPAIVSARAGNRPYGDFNDDGTVEIDDLHRFAEVWLEPTNPLAPYADLNGNGRVEMYEFAVLAAQWIQAN